MWRKTGLRELSKYLPQSVFPVSVHAALEQEDAREFRNAREAEIVVQNPAPTPEPKPEPEAEPKPEPKKPEPEHAESLAGAKEYLKRLLAELPPDVSESVLNKAGIKRLDTCVSVAKVTAACEQAEGMVG